MNDVKLNVSQSRGYEGADLIKVTTNEDGQKLVSGRELHEVLEIGTQFTKWIQRMVEYGFIEGVDFTTISQKRLTAQGNATEFIDYILTLEMAKHIAMVQRTEIGMKVRNYFIECEKVAKQQVQTQIPNSPMDVLKVMFSALEEQKQDIVEVKQDVQNFKEEMPIFTSKRKEIISKFEH